MPTPALSVVIPTHNRCEVLRATLEALEAHDGLDGALQVVVVDDGSTDDTREVLSSLVFSRLDFGWLAQEHAGPAAARNRGIVEARAERVLLLGDDTIPLAATPALHLAVAGRRALAVQGRIDWDPEREITRVMRFLAPEGPQFYFKDLEDGQPIPYTAVLASNMSAPTAWLKDEPFDERFTIAGFEDTEMAYRWSRMGRGAVFSDRARCLHRHRYDAIEPFLERQRRVGRMARLAVRLHPGLLPRTVLQPTAVGALFAVRHGLRALVGAATREHRWDLKCRWAFLRGFSLG